MAENLDRNGENKSESKITEEYQNYSITNQDSKVVVKH